jgi:hypothetical protein
MSENYDVAHTCSEPRAMHPRQVVMTNYALLPQEVAVVNVLGLLFGTIHPR